MDELLFVQMRSGKKSVGEVKSQSSQGVEAEDALPVSLSNSSFNKSTSEEPRADSRNSQGDSRESRASFRLDATTMELDFAGQVLDTLEMTIPRPKEAEKLSPEHKEPLVVSEPQPSKSGGATKIRVAFSLVGRVKEERRTRVKEISFLQLGRLASFTPSSLPTGPTLQQVVGKRFREEESERKQVMLPPASTTTPQTGARLAVAHWLNTVETPESFAPPTVLATESPASTIPMQARSTSRACSTLVGSRGHATSPQQASTVATPKLDSTQARQAPMLDTLSTFKDQDELTDVEKSVGTHDLVEKDGDAASSIDLDAELAKVVTDTGDDDPDKRLSFGKKEDLCKKIEMVSKRAAEEVISVDDEESRECTEIEQDKEVVMIDEESRELPEVEDDFLEPDEPDVDAIEDDFMAKILDNQAEFAFTQEREDLKKDAEEDDVHEEEDVLGKRGRYEDSDDEEAPMKVPFKRLRRIESDDEDDDAGRESDDGDDAKNHQLDENRRTAEDMEEGKNTQETIEAMAQAAEEVSQVRREVEEMENDLSFDGRPNIGPDGKAEEETKAGLEGENFDLSEECDFLPDEESVEEKEIFEKYEQAAADVPSQEPSLDPEYSEKIKTEVEEKPVGAGCALDSEDGGPGSDVRVIPESDEDFFSQTSNPSLIQSQTSNHDAAQGLTAASRCSPIPELSESERMEWDEEEVLGNSQKSDKEEADFPVQPPDMSKWRFAFSNLSSSARAELPEWADSLGCRGLHSKVR